MQILLSKLQSSTVFNVDRLTIYNWIRKGCPVVDLGGPGKPAQLDFQALLQWRLADLEGTGIAPDYISAMETQARARLKALIKRRSCPHTQLRMIATPHVLSTERGRIDVQRPPGG